MDEVALLENALREALHRRNQGSMGAYAFEGGAPGGQKFDMAVANYGLQLRAWIDLQVDSRLQQVLPGLLDGELAAARQDCVVAVDVAERVESEARAVAEAQAKLLAVVEGISDELARLKAAVSACQLGAQIQLTAAAAGNKSSAAGDEALIQLERVRENIEELKRVISAREQQSVNIETVSVALSRQDQAFGRAVERQDSAMAELRSEVRRLTEEVDSVSQRQAELRTVRELIAEDRLQTIEAMEQNLVSAPMLEARIDARLEALRLELLHVAAPWGELEARLAALRADVEARVQAQLEVRPDALRLENRLGALRAELEDRIEGQLKLCLEAIRLECRQTTKGHVEELQARVGEDIASLQQRLMMQLRAEVAGAIGRESAAIAALDEQLWITDQRLGQRIDELAHLHLRERVALAERYCAPWSKRTGGLVSVRNEAVADDTTDAERCNAALAAPRKPTAAETHGEVGAGDCGRVASPLASAPFKGRPAREEAPGPAGDSESDAGGKAAAPRPAGSEPQGRRSPAEPSALREARREAPRPAPAAWRPEAGPGRGAAEAGARARGALRAPSAGSNAGEAAAAARAERRELRELEARQARWGGAARGRDGATP